MEGSGCPVQVPDVDATVTVFQPWSGDCNVGKADCLEDCDGDGACNLAEYVAGTVPTNASSVLRIQDGGYRDGGFGFSFISLTGRLYSVKCADDLLTTNWVALTSNVSGTGGQMYVSDTNGTGRRFYRVGVRQP